VLMRRLGNQEGTRQDVHRCRFLLGRAGLLADKAGGTSGRRGLHVKDLAVLGQTQIRSTSVAPGWAQHMHDDPDEHMEGVPCFFTERHSLCDGHKAPLRATLCV
jgi:hypothetical protein